MSDTALLDEILDLAATLVRYPSVTVGGPVRFDALYGVRDFIHSYLKEAGLEIVSFSEWDYPALLAAFPGMAQAPVMMSGHFDVVSPEPDDSQFSPRIDGDYFIGRGCGDMKTTVATLLVWMKNRRRSGPPYPPINLLLIGNEEQGEGEPIGTPHVLAWLKSDPAWGGYEPSLLIAAERTGERGDEVWGQVQTLNRGAMRMTLTAAGRRAHSSQSKAAEDIVERLSAARIAIRDLAERHLTLQADDGWCTMVRFPFFLVGVDGVFNITADHGELGLEVRPIPQDDVSSFIQGVESYCSRAGIEISQSLVHPGIECDSQNPYLLALLAAVRRASGEEPVLGRKLAGTSARFAPDGQGVVWGQTGLHPHAVDEMHFIPSILPYYRALQEFEVTSAEALAQDA